MSLSSRVKPPPSQLPERTSLSINAKTPRTKGERRSEMHDKSNDVENEAKASKDYLSALPFEIQHIIYAHLIGDGEGKVSYVPGDYDDLFTTWEEKKQRNRAQPTRHTSQGKQFRVRYHLPSSVTPAVLLTCRRMTAAALPQYHSMCISSVESTPLLFHTLPSLNLVPDLQCDNITEGFIHLGALKPGHEVNFDNIPILQDPQKQIYPNLKKLIFVINVDRGARHGIEPCKIAIAEQFKKLWASRIRTRPYRNLPPIFFETRAVAFTKGSRAASLFSSSMKTECRTVRTVLREQVAEDMWYSMIIVKFQCKYLQRWTYDGRFVMKSAGETVDWEQDRHRFREKDNQASDDSSKEGIWLV